MVWFLLAEVTNLVFATLDRAPEGALAATFELAHTTLQQKLCGLVATIAAKAKCLVRCHGRASVGAMSAPVLGHAEKTYSQCHKLSMPEGSRSV